MRIRHVVNVVGASARGDLLEAQALTLESMAVALRATPNHIDVDIVGVRFDDEDLPVSWMRDGVPLRRSVLDLGSFDPPRRLPLLADILASFDDHDFDVGVFTNIDIALQPGFYGLIAEIHGFGHDAFSINRRTVHPRYGVNGLAWLSSQTGSAHPGHDCFVFTPEVIASADVGNVCVGAPLVARTLLFSLILGSRNFRQFVDINATFHIGDDREWASRRFDDYSRHNYRALGRVLLRLAARHGAGAVRRLPDGPRFLNAATAANPPEWLPRRLHPNHVFHPRTTDRRRMIFAASPGRSGTEYLARLLGTANQVVSCHEGEPTMAGRHLRSIAYHPRSASYAQRRVKVDALRSSLDELPNGGIFVDTTHMFVKTFADVVLDAFNHDVITVVDLHRPLTQLVGSMTELGWFTPHAPAWRDWLIPPTAPQSLFPMRADQVTGRLDVAIAYVLDSILRTRELRAATPGVHWVDLSLGDLRGRADVEQLFGKLRLSATESTWEQATRQVNHRNELKKRRGVGLPHRDIAAGIESFACRFERRISDLGLEAVFAER